MKQILSYFLISLALLPNLSSSEPFTGQHLLYYCLAATDVLDYNFGKAQMNSEYIQGTRTGICEGYIMSMLDSQQMSAKHPAFCLPANYNMLRGALVIVNYLKVYPCERRLPANQVVLKAFSSYFPCQYNG